MRDLRPLALTMGEPAGIGGEIALKAWLERETYHIPPFYLIDDPDHLDALKGRLGWPVSLKPIENRQTLMAALTELKLSKNLQHSK